MFRVLKKIPPESRVLLGMMSVAVGGAVYVGGNKLVHDPEIALCRAASRQCRKNRGISI